MENEKNKDLSYLIYKVFSSDEGQELIRQLKMANESMELPTVPLPRGAYQKIIETYGTVEIYYGFKDGQKALIKYFEAMILAYQLESEKIKNAETKQS